MKILAVLRVALRAMTRNKMRTSLTMLGIIIGVGAVIVTLAIGNGARTAVETQIQSLGTNMIMIFAGSVTRGGAHGGMGSSSRLSEDDADAIRKEVDGVEAVAPTVRTVGQIVHEDLNWSTTVQGASPEFSIVRNWNVAEGAMITDADVRGAAKVAVLGKSTADQLFPSQDPVGETIRIKNLPFRVIGVLETKGGSAMGQDQDDVVLAPYTTVQKKLMGITNIMGILVSVKRAEMVPTVQEEITRLLRQRHRIGPEQDDDFIIRTQAEFSQTAAATSRVMTILLGSIAAISLLVGGIGIMNIMLVSVTERTREIGIRMAVGARAQDILLQFLVESGVIALSGGILGAALGIIASKVLSGIAGWPTVVSPQSIVLAFLFSLVIGVFFGFYPARQAARLDPIQALRYE
jgi:putative ABC transport system permease protein